MDNAEAPDDEDNLSYSRMTLPTLTDQLKIILEQYPDNGQIIKELIQNAEDAGASAVKMCIETRNVNRNVDRPTRLCRHLQGPALCVHNDAIFSKEDWDGIKMLQCSIKKDDPLKIGRFGLGFKSVFHLTDYPCIISGSQMLLIDPHQPENKVNASLNLKNLSSKQKTEVIVALVGMFGFTNGALRTGFYNGTLLWFPLRQMPSKLSANLYDATKLKNLFESFATESAMSLIFLKYVGSIKCYVKEKLVWMPLFLSKLTDLSMQKRNYKAFVQEIDKVLAQHLPQNPISTVFKIQIDSAIYRKGRLFTQKMHTWTVVVYFMGGQASSSMQSLVNDTSLNYSPLVGIAMCNDPSQLREPNAALSGHVFCFLPLPLQSKSLTGLPVHVNGFFALSHERQHLKWTVDGEDLSRDRYVQWNRCLIEEVIPKAYKLLILNMIEDSEANVNDKQSVSAVYDCIPNATNVDPNWQLLLRPLFTSLLNEPIFRGKSDWLPFQDILMLEPQFRCIPDIGDRALKILKKSEFADRIVDVPQRITKCFSDVNVLENVITTRKFYERVFLPNIECISRDDMDAILLHTLDSRDNKLLTLLQKHKCIPSQPNGTLQFPKDLVHPNGTISKLFAKEDGRFPLESYCSPERLNVLTGLGMLKDNISWTGLLERADTITTMTNFTVAKKQSHLILKQAEKNIRREENCPQYIRVALSRIHFLPLLHKPQQWPFVWAGDEYNSEEFRRPCELYLNGLQSCVSCSKPVVDSNGVSDDILKWVGVLADVDAKLAVRQLKHYSNSNLKIHTNLVEPVYEKLSNIYEEQEDSRDAIKQGLSIIRAICVAGEMVAIRRVSLTLEHQCKPHLYQLPYFSRSRIKSFLVNVGVKEAFVPDDFVNVLKELHDLHGDQPLDASQLSLVHNVVHMLSASMIASSQSIEAIDKSRVFLPDDKSVLCQLSTLCFDDMNSMNISMEMHFLHDGISRNIAESLGIKAKRQWHMQTLANSLPFGQSEKLTSRLKRILSGYPCDQEILKELLQNADDAGATEVLFIIDETQYGGRQLFSDEWAGLQGPALCVFNNKPFTDKDLEGIQRLGEGGKSDDPSKIGQYGVGFNVVYHVTDVPSFLTKSASGNSKLCILDPHCRYVPGAGVSSPGAMYTDMDVLCRLYSDSMRCYLTQLFQKHREGTLFRLPLRVGTAAKISEINAEECKVEDIKEMFCNMTKDLHDCLLFLNNVQKVSMCHVTRGDVVVDNVVESYMTNGDEARKKTFHECQKRMLNDYKNDKMNALDNHLLLQTSYELQITDHKNDNRRWLVNHRFGLERHISSTVLRKAIADGKLIALPVGGVAIPLHPVRKVKTSPYCFLPLPIQTGLPVSINGNFALDHETRRNLWHDESGKGSKCVWNNLLIEDVIAPAYVSSLEALRDELFPRPCRLPLQICQKLMDHYHEYFPVHMKAKDDYWKHLVSSVYKHIVNQDIMLFPVMTPVAITFQQNADMCDVNWVSLRRQGFPFAYFNTLKRQFFNASMLNELADKRDKQLTAVLLRSGISLLASPLSVMSSIISSGVEIQDFIPDVLIKMLKDNPAMFGVLPQDLHETKFAETEEFKTLLQFCELSSELSSKLDGLPLLLTEDQTLRLFDRNNPAFLSWHLHLLPGSRQLFACNNCLSVYERLAKVSSGQLNVCFRQLKIGDLAAHLPSNYCSLNETCLQWSPSDYQQKLWMHRLWLFLFQETRSLSSAHEIRKQLDPLSRFCLIPVLRYVSAGYKSSYMAPISMAHKVVVLDPNSNMEKHISELDLSFLDPKTMYPEFQFNLEITEHFARIMAPEIKPLPFAIALSYIANWETMKSADFKYLVYQFYQRLNKVEQNSREQFKAVLRSLPIFKTIDEDYVHIQQDRTVVVDEIVNLSSAAIHPLSLVTRKTFHSLSKGEYDLKGLYDYLGFRSITPTEFYTRFVLPNFVNLDEFSQLEHLNYMRKELIRGGELPINENLKLSLQRTPFLLKRGKLQTANSFFAPWKPVFKMILPSEELLPEPFQKREWRNFITVAGVQTEMTENLFVKLSKIVESESKQNVDIDNLREKSKIVIREIFRFPNMTPALCSKLKDIIFIFGHEMDDQYTNICPQQLRHNGMLAFNKSVPCDQYIFCWSTSDLLPKWAIPPTQAKDALCQQLGIQCSPSPEQIVMHVSNVCLALSKTLPNVNLEEKFLTALMAKLYEGLAMCPDNTFVKHQLEDVPLIYILESGILTTIQQVVVQLPEEYEILIPYLFKASVQFGLYFSLFEKLGMSTQPNMSHFAYVLSQLHAEYMSNTLPEDAMAIALIATKGVFSCLPTDGSSIEVPYMLLWFPSRSHQMINSKDLVIVDKEELFKRTQQLELQCMIDLSEFDCQYRCQQLISSLPDEHCPRLISYMVQEKITEESLNSIVELNENVCGILQRLASPAFLEALVQLMIRQSFLNPMPYVHPDELKANFKKCIDRIDLHGVTFLETCLHYEGRRIENSLLEKSCHTEENTVDEETEYNIYLKNKGNGVSNNIICLHLAVCISNILPNKRNGRNFNMYLSSLLQADESEYEDIFTAMMLESPPGGDDDGQKSAVSMSLETCPDGGNMTLLQSRGTGNMSRVQNRYHGGHGMEFDLPDSAVSLKNVQPNSTVGHTWLLQARNDYKAASHSLKSTSTCHEWVCYQLHQSAEKALKALMYYFGSSRNVNVLEHNLTCIAQFSQEGMQLADTANALETLLVGHARMRYPHGNKAPCQVYLKTQSLEAQIKANCILVKVVKLLQLDYPESM